VPVERGALRHLDALLLVACVVEQAELDALRVLGEQREVHALAVPRGAERERHSRPDLPHRSSAPPSGSNVTAPSSTRAGCVDTRTSERATGMRAARAEKLQTSSNGPRT